MTSIVKWIHLSFVAGASPQVAIPYLTQIPLHCSRVLWPDLMRSPECAPSRRNNPSVRHQPAPSWIYCTLFTLHLSTNHDKDQQRECSAERKGKPRPHHSWLSVWGITASGSLCLRKRVDMYNMHNKSCASSFFLSFTSTTVVRQLLFWYFTVILADGDFLSHKVHFRFSESVLSSFLS